MAPPAEPMTANSDGVVNVEDYAPGTPRVSLAYAGRIGPSGLINRA